MRPASTLLALGSVLFTLAFGPTEARAEPLVTGQSSLMNECKPTKDKPYPVILVHGQAGDYRGMTGVSDRLRAEGYCVYARNYGLVPGGANGQDHLWNSADQIGKFVDDVLAKTGASKVDVVGHSAGTGVLDNYVLKKGGASKVHAFVSFGGLHHPYAHLGIPRFADFDLHLPNLLAFARIFFPGVTVAQVTDTLVSVFRIEPGLAATIQSPFVEDLFDAGYWNDLHGGPSEPPGVFLRLFTNGRTLPTHDADPGVCYTNVVGVADLLVGGSTGWQDPAGNVENFLLTSTVTANQHNDMLGDEQALSKMLQGLAKSCGGAASVTTKSLQPTTTGAGRAAAAAQREFEEAFLDALESRHGDELARGDRPADGAGAEPTGAAGCAVTSPSGDGAGWTAALAAIALGLAVLRRRR